MVFTLLISHADVVQHYLSPFNLVFNCTYIVGVSPCAQSPLALYWALRRRVSAGKHLFSLLFSWFIPCSLSWNVFFMEFSIVLSIAVEKLPNCLLVHFSKTPSWWHIMILSLGKWATKSAMQQASFKPLGLDFSEHLLYDKMLWITKAFLPLTQWRPRAQHFCKPSCWAWKSGT